MRFVLAIAFLCLSVSSVPVVRAQVATAGSQSGAPSNSQQEALPLRIGGNVMTAKLTHRVMPVYPEAAKIARVSGTVVLHVIVGKDGAVQDVRTLSGPPALMQAATDAVKQWQYQPTLLNGEPVEVDTTVSVGFTLGPVSQGAPQPQQAASNVSEQISLKDGTKINGKLTSVEGDTFHVRTSFSELSIPRSQIVSITFGSEGVAQTSTSVSGAIPVRQSIVNGTYINDTAHFTLTLPVDWKIDDELAKRTRNALGALSASDPHEKIVIQNMPPGAPAKETAQMIASSLKVSLQGFQESDEGAVRIDNRDAYTLKFSALIPVGNVRAQQGTDEPADTTVKVQVKYFVAFVPMEDRTVMIMCVAPETMYDQVDPLFHQIAMSFHGTAAADTVAAKR